MQRLPDNPSLDDTTMQACKYSMFSASQCPKALSWMAALALAAGEVEDAEQWVVELIGAVLFAELSASESSSVRDEDRDTVRMS